MPRNIPIVANLAGGVDDAPDGAVPVDLYGTGEGSADLTAILAAIEDLNQRLVHVENYPGEPEEG